ncbi:hypothetical protein phiAS5_ORF0332 [Aeromonas phage phiAS5]|uniref:Uncharacterized protein n=1 Tax=Aeromonas phage phiAS5 TaxID=879630 RepID=E1A286_9CAUD|nr:tail protein [Aeromonas phage phiAS5]ADM80175.1 hypothetical protein phiAS5_ORF0332 [Aeromonas phage phiAS5]BES53062.1 hypothetical protein [Aeromonas phage phiWae14]
MAIERISQSALENFTIDHIIIMQGDTGYEVSDAFYSLEINEGMTKGFMSGTLVINNSIDLLDGALNPRGDEYIEVSFYHKYPGGAAGQIFTKMFRVNSYKDFVDANAMNRGLVEFKFESFGSIENEFIRVSKSYKNTGTHAIVDDMLKLLGYQDLQIRIEPTLHNKDIVIPNLTPVEVISYLVNHSQSGDSTTKGDSNYYFFENRDFVNFVSGSNLINADPVAVYTYGPTIDQNFQGQLIKFARDRGYNLRDQARGGSFGVTVMSNSLIDKSYKVTPLEVESVKEVYKTLNADKWYGGSLSNNRKACMIMSCEDQMYQHLNTGSNGNSLGIQRVNRSNLSAKRAFARIGGNTDITSGSVIDLKVPSVGGNSNERDTGKWLVFSVRHLITRDNYTMDLELMSDSDIRRM